MSSYGPGADQVWERYGDLERPTVVLVHGGYFRPAVDRTHLRPMAQALAADGWHVVLAEYRRVPGDPRATLHDLDRLEDAVGEAIWVGHSAGGALAMLRHGRRVALAPVGDVQASFAGGHGNHAVRDWIGGTTEERPDDWAALDPRRVATLEGLTILHGTLDESVPLSVNAAWPVERIDGAHHFDLVDPESPWWPVVSRAVASRS